MSQFTFNRLITYFFRGLLFAVPLVLTVYIIYQVLLWLDSLVPVNIPGFGLVVIIVVVTGFGYFASSFVTRPIFEWMEKYLAKVPLVNIIYTSIKDLIDAFVGDQKKFNVPVTVSFDKQGDILKVGFVTRDDLSQLDLPGYVSVYLPHSYNFSGNHFLVEKSKVKPLDIKGASAMKFVVSGGVSGLE